MISLEKTIKNHLIDFLEKDPGTMGFVEELLSVGDLLFLGGTIRDICLFPEAPPMPRDFDIAIRLHDKDGFESIIRKHDYYKNIFGGYELEISNIEFDIWELENTWAFKNANISPSEENLTRAVYLNIDSIVYNFNSEKLYDEIFRSTIRDRKLDVITEKNPHLELNFLRAFVFKEKYGLELSDRLKTIINGQIGDYPNLFIERLLELQLSHYKNIYFSKERLEKEIIVLHAWSKQYLDAVNNIE